MFVFLCLVFFPYLSLSLSLFAVGITFYDCEAID